MTTLLRKSFLSLCATLTALTLCGTAEAITPSKKAAARLTFKELKTTRSLEVGVSHTVLLRFRSCYIKRASTSDPGIAEPVAVAENEVLIIGKKPGTVTVEIWDYSDKIADIKVHVLASNSRAPEEPQKLPPIPEAQTNAVAFEFSPADVDKIGTKEFSLPNEEKPNLSNKKLEAYDLRIRPINPGGLPYPQLEALPQRRGLPLPAPTLIVDLVPSQQKFWCSNLPLSSIYVDGARFAEPIVTAVNEMVLLGKEPGKARLAITDRAGHRVIAELRVSQGSPPPLPPQTRMPALPVGEVDLEQYSPSAAIDVPMSQARAFKLSEPVLRVAVSDPSIALPVVATENRVLCVGKSLGETTVLVWTAHSTIGLNVNVHGISDRSPKLMPTNSAEPSNASEVEYWYINRKLLRKPLNVPDGNSGVNTTKVHIPRLGRAD